MTSRSRRITPKEYARLDADLQVKAELQRAMAGNSYIAIAADLGISQSTIRNIEAGNYEGVDPYKIHAGIQREVRARRRAWHLANEAMKDLTTEAICRRHNVSDATCWRRMLKIKQRLAAEMFSNMMEKRHA